MRRKPGTLAALAFFTLAFVPFLSGAAWGGAAETPRAAQVLAKPPVFRDFPVAPDGGPQKYATKTVISSREAEEFRTVISREGRKKPNFAGHYRVAIWGCGTDCRSFAIIDRLTGEVYMLPSAGYIVGVMESEEPRIDFRADSRLFVISGTLDEKLEGKFFYEWTGKELRLLLKAPVVKKAG